MQSRTAINCSPRWVRRKIYSDGLSAYDFTCGAFIDSKSKFVQQTTCKLYPSVRMSWSRTDFVRLVGGRTNITSHKLSRDKWHSNLVLKEDKSSPANTKAESHFRSIFTRASCSMTGVLRFRSLFWLPFFKLANCICRRFHTLNNHASYWIAN